MCAQLLQSCLTLWSHGPEPSRLLSLWDFPSKNTRVRCYALLQGIFSTQGLDTHLWRLLHCRRILYCWATGKVPISLLRFVLWWGRYTHACGTVCKCCNAACSGTEKRVTCWWNWGKLCVDNVTCIAILLQKSRVWKDVSDLENMYKIKVMKVMVPRSHNGWYHGRTECLGDENGNQGEFQDLG